MRTLTLTLLAALSFSILTGCPSDTTPPDDPRASIDPSEIDRTGTCEGICGEQSPTGCWCDEQCTGYDDCCLDREAACTVVPQPDSCVGICGGVAPDGCSCVAGCEAAGDCCTDFQTACPIEPDPDSCVGHCDGQAPGGCSCAAGCEAAGDCCADFQTACPIEPDPDSCVGHCDGQAPGGCWCDADCMDFGNCCADVDAVCGMEPDPASCEGNCGGQAPDGCWCDDQCSGFGNCCFDYEPVCDPGNPGTDPWDGLSDGPLIDALNQATSGPHTGLDYTTARNHMYGVDGGIGLDIVGNGIECIYTGVTAAPDNTRTPGGLLNTEHSWPQSEGADQFPRRGDIHHLFPTEQNANSRRSSYEFNETVCAGSACPWDAGGSELGTDTFGRTVFQVRQAYRGDIARAHFYFSVRYSLPIGSIEEDALKTWHAQDPVDQRERERNAAIETVQGNRNPFVDYPEIVDRISDF